MTENRTITIAVDAVGGDFAPHEVLAGVTTALEADPSLSIALTGPADVVEPFARQHPGRVSPIVTTEVITMDEHPAAAVRAKKDSSIVVGCRLVKDGEADAFFSAGSTGAVMTAATLVMGRVKGVLRPAIATVLPTAGPPSVLLDVGANADCKPEHIVQFGQMGAAYAEIVLGVAKPSIGLLNIGEEPSKGSQLAQEAHTALAEHVSGFIGNVEGRDILDGTADVIVTDGFTGNVVLKVLEGTSRVLFGQLRSVMTATPLRKAAAAVLKPGLAELRSQLDPDAYGGAPLLGVQGVCIIAHGSSNATAVANALRVAAHAVRGGLTERIGAAVGG